MRDTDKVTMTMGQLRKLVKEANEDGQLSIQSFKVGDKVEWRDLIVNKEQWLDGVVADVNPRSGITIKFPRHPIMHPIRVPVKYISSNNLRLVNEDVDEGQHHEMRLSELISQLQKIKQDHGDLIVARHDDLDPTYWDTLLKNNYNGLFEIDREWIIF